MDLNRIFSMALRMIVKRLVGMAVGKGIEMASRTGTPGPARAEDAARQAEAKALAKRARQAARLSRRIGR
jgi:hypothetical protein